MPGATLSEKAVFFMTFVLVGGTATWLLQKMSILPIADDLLEWAVYFAIAIGAFAGGFLALGVWRRLPRWERADDDI